MLKQDDLVLALRAGQKNADKCGHFCVVGCKAAENTAAVWHNGLGSADSDNQLIHATVILGYDVERMGAHLGEWLKELHARKPKRDLNLVR